MNEIEFHLPRVLAALSAALIEESKLLKLFPSRELMCDIPLLFPSLASVLLLFAVMLLLHRHICYWCCVSHSSKHRRTCYEWCYNTVEIIHLVSRLKCTVWKTTAATTKQILQIFTQTPNFSQAAIFCNVWCWPVQHIQLCLLFCVMTVWSAWPQLFDNVFSWFSCLHT